jgi:hypothetical protein
VLWLSRNKGQGNEFGKPKTSHEAAENDDERGSQQTMFAIGMLNLSRITGPLVEPMGLFRTPDRLRPNRVNERDSRPGHRGDDHHADFRQVRGQDGARQNRPDGHRQGRVKSP